LVVARAVAAAPPDAIDRVAARVAELLSGYAPPDFAEVPDADAALSLCAIDHHTGYRGRYLVEGVGPYEGSALLWALGLREERRRPGALGAAALAEVTAEQVGELFRIGGERIGGPWPRSCWRVTGVRRSS
jgi:hypothetical protein